MKKQSNAFTLLEVVVALAIFSLGLGVVFSVTAMARARTVRGREMVRLDHMLTQATEYFLLVHDADELPEEVFPYPGYAAHVSCDDIDDPPDGAVDGVGALKLKLMTVTLTREGDDAAVASVSMERIMADER